MEELQIVIAFMLLVNTVILIPMRASINRIDELVKSQGAVIHNHESRLSFTEGKVGERASAN